MILAIWLALNRAINSQITLFSALNSTFCPANEKGTLRQNNQSDFEAHLFKVTIMKLLENEVNFATFVPKTLPYITIDYENGYN